ncbi:hypothetical protein HYW35_02810 [Candidatus Saccharibacteria bacterium]|nr:hypothetical protein [Candidatus Saccharibacteria bacterium]
MVAKAHYGVKMMTEEKQRTETPDQTPEDGVELSLPKESIEAPEPDKGGSRLRRFKSWYLGDKKKSIPITVAILLLIIFAIPSSRYKLAGLALAKNFTLQVMDATANTPVSDATLKGGSLSVQTDGNGKAVLRLAVGHHRLSITKKYYADRQADVVVPILSQKNPATVAFTATGRQVKVVVSNTISHQKVGDVKIKVLDVEAKTDKDGSATIVLPVGIASSQANLSSDGYNDSGVVIEISDKTIKDNKYNLTPAGKIYFLSKLSGKIDVVKANLDGSDRKIVLAGTGKEDDSGTAMLASRDWKYLALLSRRDSDLAKLYIIETATDQTTAIDEGNATFALTGWSDNNFVYQVDRIGYQLWQPKAQALKVYNIQTKQIILLDQTKGEGTNDTDYARESYEYGQVYLIDKNVIYVKGWSSDYSNPGALNGRQAAIYIISATGSGAQTLKTFNYQAPENGSIYFASIQNTAQQIYYQVVYNYGNYQGESTNYYAYVNGKITSRDDLSDVFNKYRDSSPTYIQSPVGNDAIWMEMRDGKKVLVLGSQADQNGKTVATLSDEYQVYGWFSDDYLLISKKSSELYILPRAGIKKESELLKIADYHNTTRYYPRYISGGYGGL